MENTIHWLAPVAPFPTSPKQQPEVGSGIVILQTPLHEQLLATKNDIDRITPVSFWDDAKKITNPYEYIFLSLQRRMNRSVAALQPLSRSYFKMIELWTLLDLSAAPIKATAHSAEGPGGFLEAIQDRTGHTTPMVAMTLKSTGKTIPGWRKSQAFLTRHPQVQITYGWDGTGNLYSLLNQQSFESAARSIGGADLYTADGGFDFSADFNGQENTVQRLLAAEALAALRSLNATPTATAILKVFDTKNAATLDLLWMLSTCFERTGLVKPHTSRPANSERYWVGVGYRGAPAWILEFLATLTRTDAPAGWNQLFHPGPWPADWLIGVRQFQEKIEAQQLKKIQETLDFIRAPSKARVQVFLLENVRNSRRWCTQHAIPINPAYAGLTEEAVAALNLEEALDPFPASAARTNSPASSPPPPTHRVSSVPPALLPPAVPAWRTALPASVLGRTPSQTDAANPPSSASAPSPPQSVPASSPGPEQP
jgi:hypothetical protein